MAADAERLADLAQPAVEAARIGHHLVHAGEAREALRERLHGGIEGGESLGPPGFGQARHDRAARRGQRGLDRAQQGEFLHPAPRERIERQHGLDLHVAAQVLAPALDFCRLKRRLAWRAELVEQHDDRLGDPAEQRQLRSEVGRGLGRI